MTTKPILTIAEAKKRNREAGMYWFEPDTMKFFRSRLENIMFGDHKAEISYFVTSEQHGPIDPRLYSVRSINWRTAEVETIGKFQGYETREAALRAARRLVEGS